MKNWTTTQLIAAGGLGVLTIVLTLPGVLISNITQIPGSSIPFAGFFAAMMAVIILFLFKKFGAATISMSVYGILSLPLPVGPPGFLPKILIFLFTGFILDMFYIFLSKETKMNALFFGIILAFFHLLAWLAAYLIFLPQLAAIYAPFLLPLLILGVVIGASGGLTGYFVYGKILRTAVVKRIRGNR